jgi:hypothetical protein
MEATPMKPTTKLEKWINRLKNHKILAAVLFIGIAIIALASFTDAIDKLLVFTKLKPDALTLARDSARDEFSRQLTRSAWKRLYWSRVYLTRTKLGAPLQEREEAWRKLLEAAEDWNANSMINIDGLDYYYGAKKSEQFELSIQPKFDTITTSIRTIRYAMIQKGENPSEAEIQRINDLIDSLNVELYVFVRGFRATTVPTSGA